MDSYLFVSRRKSWCRFLEEHKNTHVSLRVVESERRTSSFDRDSIFRFTSSPFETAFTLIWTLNIRSRWIPGPFSMINFLLCEVILTTISEATWLAAWLPKRPWCQWSLCSTYAESLDNYEHVNHTKLHGFWQPSSPCIVWGWDGIPWWLIMSQCEHYFLYCFGKYHI